MRIEALCRMPMIMEAVLYAPIETVLAPYVEQAPNDETKKWLLANFKNWLLKSSTDLYQLPYLPRNATEQQKKAFSFNDLYDVRLSAATQTMLEHLLDFWKNYPNPQRLERMSVENMVQAADEAVRRYNASKAKEARQVEDNPGVKTVMEFHGGLRFVELTNQPALDREGSLMGHCVGSMHGCYIENKTRRIFSLRDAENEPHVTIEVNVSDMETTEIKGRSNAAPVRRYWPMIHAFIDKFGIKVDNDYRNIGLLNIENPETRETRMMSQSQFRDMVLDPDNAEGQAFLAAYQKDTRKFRWNADLTMGMFTALYGTDQLVDETIDTVFRSMTDNAIQVVQQYGNRLTPEQQVIAFAAIPNRVGRDGDSAIAHYKGLLTATKPDADLAYKIVSMLEGEHERGGRSQRDTSFVTALSQTLPETYKAIVSNPEALKHELESDNERAAGPFFAFVGTDALTTEMVAQAFRYFPEDALKRIMSAKIALDQQAIQVSITMLLARYWSERGAVAGFFDKFVAYTKPDSRTLRHAFETADMSDSKELSYLLMAARNHVPDQLDRETVEKAVLAINDDDVYKQYLASELEPSLQIQQRLLAKDKEDFKSSRAGKRLHYLRQIDPSIYKEILEYLRPEAIPTETEDYRNTYKGGVSKSHKYKRPLKPEERTGAIDQERKEAIRRFLALLAPALTEPSIDHIDPSTPKFRAARAAFEAMGKGKLFDVAVGRLVHRKTIAAVRSNAALFQQHLANDPSLTAREIVDTIGDYQSRGSFTDVVNFAPQRVPEILATPLHFASANTRIYGKLDGPLDKEKTFQSLEYVWASTRVPEGVKDDYTLNVFKRFKPGPDKLIQMLEKADSLDATRYVVKKTKKPSRDLTQFVLDGFPELLPDIALDAIPDDLLAKIFGLEPLQAGKMMNRDLRNYGTESRSKHASKTFRSKIDRKSPAFARYQKAAEAGGKAEYFARYARQGELENLHDKLTTGRDTVNMELLTKHLDEYSNRTLIHVAHHSESIDVYKLYLAHFDEKKLAGLINGGLFKQIYYGGYFHGAANEETLIPKLDRKKLTASFTLALEKVHGGHSSGAQTLLRRMVKAKFKFDDALIIAILKAGTADSDEKSALLHNKIGDDVKNWVADNNPHEMDDIPEPNDYMIQVLFDKYAKLSRSYQKDVVVDYWFESAVKAWFNKGPSYSFKYRPNPRVAKMLTDEAKKRKGVAVSVVTAIFRHINALRNKGGDAVLSHATVALPPRGAKIEKD